LATSNTGELPIAQKTYDLIKWYVPILNRLLRDLRFFLGDRIINRKSLMVCFLAENSNVATPLQTLQLFNPPQ
jgi:hypothetical protein